MTVRPNLQGFANAQRELRGHFGQDVTFHIPVAAVYEPGVEVDPESDQPFDPWTEDDPAQAVSPSGTRDVVKRVSVVNRPFANTGLGDSAEAAPIGFIGADRMGLLVAEEDWPDVREATHVTVFDERFKITDSRPDATGTVYKRRIVYLTKG